jgi:hypothetical protein
MSALPITVWQTALDQMHAALANATRALDRAEERWERAVAPSAGEGAPPPALVRLDARLGEWDSRLRAADELTRAVEKTLAERAGALERWRAVFAEWDDLLKRTGPGTAPPTGPDPVPK